MTWRKLWLYPYRAMIVGFAFMIITFYPVNLYVTFTTGQGKWQLLITSAFICGFLIAYSRAKDKKKWLKEIWG